MTTNLPLSLVAGCLIACGVYLLTARGVVRALLGVLLMSNGINVLFLVASGPPGRAPIVESADPSAASAPTGMADPLPQALVLTAIVITLAVTAFVMALSYRNAADTTSDAIVDDSEDVKVIARAGHPGQDVQDQTEVDVLVDPLPDLPGTDEAR